jgi:hypothetical protein
MAYGITDFSRSYFQYTDDRQFLCRVQCRTVYTPALTGMSAWTSATISSGRILTKHCRRRYMESVDGGHNSVKVVRHFPINIAMDANPLTVIPNIDGITDWKYEGYRGEVRRGGANG